jgi:hypothetical protein
MKIARSESGEKPMGNLGGLSAKISKRTASRIAWPAGRTWSRPSVSGRSPARSESDVSTQAVLDRRDFGEIDARGMWFEKGVLYRGLDLEGLDEHRARLKRMQIPLAAD